MTYTKSAFEMPDGKYLARFLGTTFREDKLGDKPRLGQDGKPLPPAMTWDFEITDGPEAGKKTDKLTGRIPTPKSGCGKMLAAIADTVLKDGVEVELEDYVGKLYRVTVVESRVQDSPPPVRVYDHELPAAPAASGPPPRNGGPPPRPQPPAEPAYWVVLKAGAEPEKATAAQIKAVFDATPGLDVNVVEVCPDGGSEWVSLAVAVPESRGWIPF
jgi:hypothetical protein